MLSVLLRVTFCIVVYRCASWEHHVPFSASSNQHSRDILVTRSSTAVTIFLLCRISLKNCIPCQSDHRRVFGPTNADYVCPAAASLRTRVWRRHQCEQELDDKSSFQTTMNLVWKLIQGEEARKRLLQMSRVRRAPCDVAEENNTRVDFRY